MAWYSILPAHLSSVETWVIRLFVSNYTAHPRVELAATSSIHSLTLLAVHLSVNQSEPLSDPARIRYRLLLLPFDMALRSSFRRESTRRGQTESAQSSRWQEKTDLELDRHDERRWSRTNTSRTRGHETAARADAE
jgi:hypothetical protein